MPKLDYEEKIAVRERDLPRRNLATAEDLNEIKDAVNALYDYLEDGLPLIKQAAYVDTANSEGSPQVIPANGYVPLENNAGTVISFLPEGEDPLYDGARIRPLKAGDLFTGYVSFIGANSSPNGDFEVGIDIGPEGSPNIIFQQEKNTTKGANTFVPYTIPINGYCGANFLANGGKPVIRSTTGTLSVYNVVFYVGIITKKNGPN